MVDCLKIEEEEENKNKGIIKRFFFRNKFTATGPQFRAKHRGGY